MTPSNIKPKNLAKIIALLNADSENCVQGSQFYALLRLIEQKGDVIQCDNDKHEINGLKCLMLPNGKYITIKITPLGKTEFKRVQTYLLTEEKESEQ